MHITHDVGQPNIKRCNLVLRLSVSSTSHFLKVVQWLLTPCHVYIYFQLSCKNVLWKAVIYKYVTKPVGLSSFILRRMFLSSLTPCNISSFFTPDFLHAIENVLLNIWIFMAEFISQIVRLPSPIGIALP
jgi:hypothetical protein